MIVVKHLGYQLFCPYQSLKLGEKSKHIQKKHVLMGKHSLHQKVRLNANSTQKRLIQVCLEVWLQKQKTPVYSQHY
jgi:hypothetical protein